MHAALASTRHATRSVARRAQRGVGAIAARAHRTALAHGIHRVRSGAFLHGALLAFREHTCVSLCLSHDSDFFPRAFPQSRAAADQYASLLSTPACFSLPRDCPILRPRAVGCLSRAEGMRLSVRDELRSHTPHAIPLILPACCGLLHACVETLQAPLELSAARGPISPCCRFIHTSLVRRMNAMLINCVAEKTIAHSDIIRSVAFSPDGTKIVSGSADKTIKVWDSGAPRAQNRPSLAKTDACWLVWQPNWSC